MALPKIETLYPTHEVTLPVSKRKVRIRPFLVRDEKALLIIKEAKSVKEVSKIVCDVISACVVSEKLDARDLPEPDVEYLFLKTRCISKGQTADLAYRCNHQVPYRDKDGAVVEGAPLVQCGAVVSFHVDLDKLEPTHDGRHTTTVQVGETPIYINFRYPTFRVMERTVDDAGETQNPIETVMDLVESVTDSKAGTVHTDFTREELAEMMNSLDQETERRILEDFMGRMPTIKHDLHFRCPKCGHEETLHLEGLQDFS